MRRSTLGSTAFFLVAPGVVAGLVPWAVTRWAGSPPGVGALDVAGCLLVAAGVGVVVACFAQFVREGHGTPAPVAPPDTLVVGGLYRHVRNPMYLGVGAAIVGQVLAFRSVQLTVWLIGFAIAVTTFVVLYEKPTLSRQFGASYDRYRREVRPGCRACVRGSDSDDSAVSALPVGPTKGALEDLAGGVARE